MTNLPEDLVRFYQDGPDWPQTPEQQEAERVYRDAFLLSAREAAHGTSIDQGAIDRAWEERRRVRQQAEVQIHSAGFVGDPDLKSKQVFYCRDHLIDASCTNPHFSQPESLVRDNSAIPSLTFRVVKTQCYDRYWPVRNAG